jgi:hypothetical protein
MARRALFGQPIPLLLRVVLDMVNFLGAGGIDPVGGDKVARVDRGEVAHGEGLVFALGQHGAPHAGGSRG